MEKLVEPPLQLNCRNSIIIGIIVTVVFFLFFVLNNLLP